MQATISDIVQDEGFQLNTKKTRFARKHQRQEVTGILINSGTVKVSKDYKRSLSQAIYFCSKYSPTDHQKRIGDSHSFYKEHLYGKAYFVKMVEPQVGEKLLERLDKILWEY